MYSDNDCPRSRDIDDLERKVSDLDFYYRRGDDDLLNKIDRLEEMIDGLRSRIVDLENTIQSMNGVSE